MVAGSNLDNKTKIDRKHLVGMNLAIRAATEFCTAVEQDDIGKVRSMLERKEVDVNRLNLDDFTPLDCALMLGHNEVALLLLKYGAQENPKLSCPQTRSKHLQRLIDEASSKIARHKLTPPSGKIIQAYDIPDKEMSYWESRHHMLRKMRHNFDGITVPECPKFVCAQVASSTSLLVQFEPPGNLWKCVVTKYKIEWSHDPHFSNLAGTILVKDLRRLDVTITSLSPDEPYSIRVTAGNIKGFGLPQMASPSSTYPSTWKDVDPESHWKFTRLSRSDYQRDVNQLFYDVMDYQQSEIFRSLFFGRSNSGMGDTMPRRKKSSLRNLFLPSARFQKNLQRNSVYLASVVYCEDRIACTLDDCLPVLLIDSQTSTTGLSASDFNWFLKVSCSWEDIRLLFFDPELSNSVPALSFRSKMLETAAAMQTALGIQDLGRLHYKPIDDENGTTILVAVQNIADPKAVQGLQIKWMSINKLLRKQMPHSLASFVDEVNLPSSRLLVTQFLSLLNFYENAYLPVDRGLYMGYLKLHTTVTQMSVVVPENLPSVLPFIQIRENPHVSREEWEWLKALDTAQNPSLLTPTPAQLSFHWALVSVTKILLTDLNISENDIQNHRLYRWEVIEIHPDVSLLLLIPEPGSVCTAPCSSQTDDKPGCLSLPLKLFEMIHLCTYQPEFISLYCRLSAFLEHCNQLAQQLLRQSLSEAETETAREQVTQLAKYQERLDEIWKNVRWISDAVIIARDKQGQCTLPLRKILNYAPVSSQPPPRRLPSNQIEDAADVGYYSDHSQETAASTRLSSAEDTPSGSVASAAGPRHSLTVENPTYYALAQEPPSAPSVITNIPVRTHVVEYVNFPLPERSKAAPNENDVTGPRHESFLKRSQLKPLRSLDDYVGCESNGPSRKTSAVRYFEKDELQVPPPFSEDFPRTVSYINCSDSDTVSVSSSQNTDLHPSGTNYLRVVESQRRHSSNTTVSDTEAILGKRECRTTKYDGPSIGGKVNQSEVEDLTIIDEIYCTGLLTAAQSAAKNPNQLSPNAELPLIRPHSSSDVCLPSNNNRKVQRSTGSLLSGTGERGKAQPAPSCDILRVYAAYETGLKRGTNVRVFVAPTTSARDIVTLVVKELNKASAAKGVPETQKSIDDFCLAVIVGTRERCLRDSFRPLDLQNPWLKGTLFVRRKDDVLAALDYCHGSEV